MENNLYTDPQERDHERMGTLKVAHALLKNFFVDEARQVMECLDLVSLTPGLQMYAHYIIARCDLSEYQKSWEFKDLKSANWHLSELVRIAHDNCIKPKNPNYQFTRALVKFQLSEEPESEDRVGLRNHARRLAEKGMELYPELTSFKWLYEQITEK